MRQALIVDDHPLVCQGVKELLQTHFPSLEVKISAGGEGVLQELCGSPWAFVVLDVSLPDQSGLKILKQMKVCCPNIPVIVFSAHSERQYAMRALRAGAIEYLSKEDPPGELLEVVRQILAGSRMRRPIPRQPILSARERQVLRLLARGMRRAEVAQQLKISEKTVSAHQANLLLKLELRNVVELVRYAIEEGL
jgi:DNA-binding NarL/FixJ family response regulator